MPFGVTWWEILIVLALLLLVFGPKRLPEMGRSLGRGIREFKDSLTSSARDEERTADELPPARDEERATARERERDAVP